MTRHAQQQALDFRVAPMPPLRPRTPVRTSPKRGRASTGAAAPTLPPHHRSRPPPLKTTNSFLFKGLHPLYTRHILNDHHEKMEIRCGQDGCEHKRVIPRSLSGTNNYKTHYKSSHPGIPTSETEEKELIYKRTQEAGMPAKQFFDKTESSQTYNERFRHLLLDFITKNNLSFSLVDQQETRDLFTFLSPTIIQVSRRTLIRDLKARYELTKVEVQKTLQLHIQSRGRIALTTNA